MFNAKKEKERIVQWIQDYFAGTNFNAVIGISGGKDSSIVAALCVEALGKGRVIGVLMPKGEQADIADSLQLVNHLGIKHRIINIGKPVDAYIRAMQEDGQELSKMALVNIPDHIRMAMLYSTGASENALVANTSNLSENYIGYTTKFGTSKGDFSPLSDYTVTEAKAIGKELGLPLNLIDKTPADGLSGLTDEQNIGFPYAVLDVYIREGICEDAEIKAKIDKMHTNSRHKFTMPKCEYNPMAPNLARREVGR